MPLETAGLRLEPMLCVAARELPSGPGWAYEIKLDGYRALGLKSGGRIALGSRNGKDFTRRFGDVARALHTLPDERLLDGEIVAVHGDGTPAFSLLQEHSRAKPPILLYAFDAPFLAGLDLRRHPLGIRRYLLHDILATVADPIRFSETFDVPAAELMRVVREKRLEGVVAKRRNSLYSPGRRDGEWVKVRANRIGEFIIGGYMPSPRSIEAILVGQPDGRGLTYLATVRAGFDRESRAAFLAAFVEIGAVRCPFGNLPDRGPGRCSEGVTAEKMAACRWLKPRLAVSIELLEWTPEMRLRHPRFAGSAV